MIDLKHINLTGSAGGTGGGGGAPAGEAYTKAQSDARFAKKGDLTALDQKVGEFEEDFAKYENRPDIELTPIVSGKYINSEGKYVDAAGWAVAEIGAIEKGLRYKLYIKDASEMILGDSLFVSRVRTFDDKGEVIRTTLTPIFSARDTNIPTHGKVVLKAWDDYADVLVCYKPALTDKIEVVCYGGDKSDATQMKNLKDDIDRKATKAGRYLDLTSGMTLAFEPTKDGDTTAYDERLTAGRNVNFAPQLTDRVPDEENKSYGLTFDGMRGEVYGGNQMCKQKTETVNGVKFTCENGVFKLSGTATVSGNVFFSNASDMKNDTHLTVGYSTSDKIRIAPNGNPGYVNRIWRKNEKFNAVAYTKSGENYDGVEILFSALDVTELFPTDTAFVTSLTINDALKVLHRLSFFSYEQNMETLEITENVDDTLALGAEVISKMGYQESRLTFGSNGRIHLIDGKDGKTIKGTIDMRTAKRAAWAQVLEQLAAQGVDTSLPFMQEPFEMSINDQVGIKWDAKGVEVSAWVVEFDGNEDWSNKTGYKSIYSNTNAKLWNDTNTQKVLAIEYEAVKTQSTLINESPDKAMCVFEWGHQLCFKDISYTDLAAWKQHLADIKAAGTPLRVIYQLATPIRVDFEDMALNLGFADVQSDDFFALDDMDGNHMYSIDVQYETRDGVQYKKVRISPNAEWVAEHGQLPTDIMTSVLGFGFTANYATMLQMYKDIQQLKNR